MKSSFISVFFAAALFAACSGNNQAENKDAKANSVVQSATFAHLRNDIAKYIAEKGVSVGVAVVDFSSKDTLSVNGQHHFAMMSVCKFPQAITLLHLVDSGMLQRNAKVQITSYDLTVPTNSTLKKDHPKAPFDLSIQEALAYSIGQSDNITSNVIFAMDGGPSAVETYIHSLGINDIGVGVDYRHMFNDSFYRNWITPMAAAELLYKFYTQKILSDTSRATLWKAMVDAPNGKNRLPGLLPANTVIGHKTGTSGRDSTNATIAYNDIGIIMLPDGRAIAVAVFIERSTLTDDENANTIATIGKMVWDYYTKK